MTKREQRTQTAYMSHVLLWRLADGLHGASAALGHSHDGALGAQSHTTEGALLVVPDGSGWKP